MFSTTQITPGQNKRIQGSGHESLSLTIVPSIADQITLTATIRLKDRGVASFSTAPAQMSALSEFQRLSQCFEKSFRRGGAADALDSCYDIKALTEGSRFSLFTPAQQKLDQTVEERRSEMQALAKHPCIYGNGTVLFRENSFIVNEQRFNAQSASEFSLKFPLPRVSDPIWTGDCVTHACFFLDTLRRTFPGESFELCEYKVPFSNNRLAGSHFQIRDPQTGIRFESSKFFGSLVENMVPFRVVELNPTAPCGIPFPVNFGDRPTWISEFEHKGDNWATSAGIFSPNAASNSNPQGKSMYRIFIHFVQSRDHTMVRDLLLPIPFEYSDSDPLLAIRVEDAYKWLKNSKAIDLNGLPLSESTLTLDDALLRQAAPILTGIWNALKRGQVIRGQIPPALLSTLEENYSRMAKNPMRWWG